jgi:fused signal recognition particle receptor
MFNFLKEKLKSALAKFSKDVDEEAEDVVEEAPKPEKKAEKTEKAEKKKEAPKAKPKPEPEPEPEQKKEKPAKEKTRAVEKKPQAPAEKKEEPAKPALAKPTEPAEQKVAEPEEQEPEAPEEELSIELIGIKEALEEYSEQDIDQVLDVLGDVSRYKRENADKSAKINLILSKPLAKIQSALDQFGHPEEKTAEKEEKEEEEKEEKLLEEVEKEEEELEEQPKKQGFFKRIFGFGKKKEEEPEEKEEEPEEEAEKEEAEKEEKKVPEEIEGPPAPPEEEEAEEEKKYAPPEKKLSPKEELEEVEEERKKVTEEIEEEDKEIEQAEEQEKEDEEESKGFFARIKQGFTLKTLSDSKFENIFFELEMALLENNVAVEVIEKIKQDLRERLVDKKLKRSEINEIVIESLKKSLDHILSVETFDVVKRIKEKKKAGRPYVIIFVGINGSGKTTTIAKMAKHFMDNGMKPVMVAADTFRAAAIQQLEEHANNLGVKLIKHDYGSDPAAVAFDGIKYAEAKGIDVVLVGTAGRLHSNTNLMDEMKKIIRVANPDMKVFIGESITGNDCVEQAKKFNEAIGIDGIVLSKADVDEKGGAAISVSYVTGKPILFIGTGQTYDSLQKFEKKMVLSNLGLE